MNTQNQQPYQQKEGNGSLFTNSRKTQQNQPDYNGSILINGVECWMNGWLKVSSSGTQYLSISVKPKDQQAQQAPPQQQQFQQQTPAPQSVYPQYQQEPQHQQAPPQQQFQQQAAIPQRPPQTTSVPPQSATAQSQPYGYPQGVFAPQNDQFATPDNMQF